jgi:peptide/nickel transport system permease protein
MAFVLLGGIAVVVGNLVADILYGVVDPRIKY